MACRRHPPSRRCLYHHLRRVWCASTSMAGWGNTLPYLWQELWRHKNCDEPRRGKHKSNLIHGDDLHWWCHTCPCTHSLAHGKPVIEAERCSAAMGKHHWSSDGGETTSVAMWYQRWMSMMLMTQTCSSWCPLCRTLPTQPISATCCCGTMRGRRCNLWQLVMRTSIWYRVWRSGSQSVCSRTCFFVVLFAPGNAYLSLLLVPIMHTGAVKFLASKTLKEGLTFSTQSHLQTHMIFNKYLETAHILASWSLTSNLHRCTTCVLVPLTCGSKCSIDWVTKQH